MPFISRIKSLIPHLEDRALSFQQALLSSPGDTIRTVFFFSLLTNKATETAVANVSVSKLSCIREMERVSRHPRLRHVLSPFLWLTIKQRDKSSFKTNSIFIFSPLLWLYCGKMKAFLPI